VMEREQFKILVKAMKATYTSENFIPDADAFAVWYEMLKDLSYEHASLAIRKYMLTEKFPPTIADIRTKAREIAGEPDNGMSELEAWALVKKAICNSNYHSEEEFASLPKTCQIAVGNPANLREWAAMDTESVETVEQSHFIRNYRAAVQREKDSQKMPESVRTMIETLREKLLAGESNTLEDKDDGAKVVLETVSEPQAETSPIPESVRERLERMRKEFDREDGESK